jgi:hypothetical protein
MVRNADVTLSDAKRILCRYLWVASCYFGACSCLEGMRDPANSRRKEIAATINAKPTKTNSPGSDPKAKRVERYAMRLGEQFLHQRGRQITLVFSMS